MLLNIVVPSIPLLILITVLGFITGCLLGKLRRKEKELRQRKNMSLYIHGFDGIKESSTLHRN